MQLDALCVLWEQREWENLCLCSNVNHFEKMKYITRTFLICPTKQSNAIFNNLKTLNEKKDVCDDEHKCKLAMSNVLTGVKKEWNNYEQDVKYAHAYKNTQPNLGRLHWKTGIYWRVEILVNLHLSKEPHTY